MVQSVTFNAAASASSDPVRDAIRAASRATGVSFDYLLRTAERESSLDPTARARTSSATGLFQFLDQTWLGIMKDAGAQHGFAREAEAIERRPDGRLVVADPAERTRILAMRLDPATNAVMGAEFSRRNTAELTQALGRAPSGGELYVAHFLGSAGAARFLRQADESPDAPAASQFVEAARANPTIFFERGRPRTFAEVRDRLVAPQGQSATVVAAIEAGSRAEAVPQVRPIDDRRVFHSLFRGEGRGPVSGLVRAVWGGSAEAQAYAPSRREPFFPSAALRVGTVSAPVGAGVGAIAAVAPGAPPVSSPDVTAFAATTTAAAVVAVPLPLDRPATDPARTSSRPMRPPIDLMSFTRVSGR